MSSTIHLHSNPIIAYGQVIIWLLLHPSAWREYVRSADVTTPPALTLSCFFTPQQHPPPLQQLCHGLRIIQPLVVGLGIGALMLPFWLGGLVKFIDVIYGVSVGVMLSLVGGGVSSLAISLPFGLLFGGIGGLLVGTGFGIGMGISYPNFDVPVLSLTVFAISLAGSVSVALQEEPHQRTIGWQIGSFVMGIVVGLAALTAILIIGAYGLADQLLSPALQQMLGHLQTLEVYRLTNLQKVIDGLADPDSLKTYPRYIAIAFLVGLFLGGFRKKGWRVALLWGLVMGGVMTVVSLMFHGVFYLMESGTVLKRFLSGSFRGILYGMSFVILFMVPYLLARRLANRWAGMVAGILGYVVISLAIRLDWNWQDPLFGKTLLFSVVAFIVGTTYQRWLPLLLYPFESAANLVIYRLQDRHPERTLSLLPWHPAFWDEHQYLRLWGLETWLINVAKQDATLGQQALLQLSQGRQKWAVQAMRMEFNTQRLEQCQTVHDIAAVHENLMGCNELTAPANQETEATWLQRFANHSRDVETALKQLSSYQQSAGLKTVIARLEEFLVGIMGRTNGQVDVQRFQEITVHWKDILAKYAEEILTVVIETPYVVGAPLDERHHRIFAPRTEISHQLRESLLSPNCPPLLLYGQRRTGKTSLLKYLNFSQLLPNYILIFVDCQGFLNEFTNYVSFFYNLGRNIGNVIQAQCPGAQVPVLTRDMLQDDPFTSFDEWLDQLEQVLQGKSLLVALDEFVLLEEAFQKGRMERASLLGKIRNLIQHRPRIRWLFSGTHSFEELQHWATYFIQVRTLHLGYLTAEEAHKLVTKPVDNFLLKYVGGADQHILQITRCHPALIQMICDQIVFLKNKQPIEERLTVQPSDVETAAIEVLKWSQMLFVEIAEKQVDANAQKVLQFIASQGENAVVTRPSLGSLLATEDELHAALTLLLRRELIEEVTGEKDAGGGYRFQIELIRRWFTRRK